MGTNGTSTRNGQQFVKVEMWNDVTGEVFSRHYPVTMRRYDMLRNLASYALAVPGPLGWMRAPRHDIRINSIQGVAWLKSNPAYVAYFQN